MQITAGMANRPGLEYKAPATFGFGLHEDGFEKGKPMDLDFKKLKILDPVQPQGTVDFDAQKGCSPFDPPDAYAQPVNNGVTPQTMHPYLKGFVAEHNEFTAHLGRLDELVGEIQREGAITDELFAQLREFFGYFETEVIAHNRREERELFPILHQRLLERGEHSIGPNPVTPISVLDGEHIEAVQISAVALGFCALAHRLEDPGSRAMVLSIAMDRCEALSKMLRLHIFREDRIVFALAQEFLSARELESLGAGAEVSNPSHAATIE